MRDRTEYFRQRYQARKARIGRRCVDCGALLTPHGAGHTRCHTHAALASPGVLAAGLRGLATLAARRAA